MRVRAAVAVVLALVLPGAGHVFLGRRGRGVAFFCIVLTLFLVGVAVAGSLYTLVESRGSFLRTMATLASMGSGAIYFIAHVLAAPANVDASTIEYGRTFTLTAGVMNLLLALDCYDMASGAKKW